MRVSELERNILTEVYGFSLLQSYFGGFRLLISTVHHVPVIYKNPPTYSLPYSLTHLGPS